MELEAFDLTAFFASDIEARPADALLGKTCLRLVLLLYLRTSFAGCLTLIKFHK